MSLVPSLVSGCPSIWPLCPSRMSLEFCGPLLASCQSMIPHVFFCYSCLRTSHSPQSPVLFSREMVCVTTEGCIHSSWWSCSFGVLLLSGWGGGQVRTVHLCLHTPHVWYSDPVTKVGKSYLSHRVWAFSPEPCCCSQAVGPGESLQWGKTPCFMAAKKHEREDPGSHPSLQWLSSSDFPSTRLPLF